MAHSNVTRRKTLKLAAVTAALPLLHIRTAGAAGKVTAVFTDHFVPASNELMRKQIAAWGEANKVEVQADFLSSQLLMVAAAEKQAGTGHDIMTLPTWEVHNHAKALVPMDDVVARLTAKFGGLDSTAAYLAQFDGHWMACPSSVGSQFSGPLGRISMLKEKAGLDVLAMYPARNERTALADAWTYEAHLKAAEACHKAGLPFAIGLGTTADSANTSGALFAAYGAELVDSKGNITVNSESVRQVLEHAQRLVRVLPADAASYDDASNNRALISGKSALIWNPPSPWAIARRDAPQIAQDIWAFPAPSGPKGRFMPTYTNFWGVWNFSRNQTAAKELIEFLMQRDNVEARCSAVLGYDIPPFPSMRDFSIWEEAGPPKGAVYNYPVRPHHDAKPHIAGVPAPPEVAVQIYNRGTMPTMLAKLASGQTVPQVINWATSELEGFLR